VFDKDSLFLGGIAVSRCVSVGYMQHVPRWEFYLFVQMVTYFCSILSEYVFDDCFQCDDYPPMIDSFQILHRRAQAQNSIFYSIKIFSDLETWAATFCYLQVGHAYLNEYSLIVPNHLDRCISALTWTSALVQNLILNCASQIYFSVLW